MPTVEVSERLDASIRDVWDLVCDLEAYPRFMEPVRSLRVLDRGDDWIDTAWEVELKGSILRWIERGVRNDAQYRLEYRQLDGDLDRFEGYWQLTERDAKTTDATLAVTFEIGIPMLREMLDPVAERAIRENSLKMLRSLSPRVSIDQRQRAV